MRSFRPADTRSLPNLLRNGGFDYAETVDDVLIPHHWTFDGLTTRAASEEAASSYEVILGEAPAAGGLVDYLKLTILDGSEVGLAQSLVSSAVLDFPVPTPPGSARSEVPAGYIGTFERLVTRTRPMSLGISIRVVRGSVAATVRVSDAAGSLSVEASLSSRINSAITKGKWQRLAVSFTPSSTPASVALVFTRLPGSDLAEVHIGNIQMVLGAYADVPYTGDLSLGVMPTNSVIMTFGASCPPGFVELEEPAGTVPEAWLAVDPNAKLRAGAFPFHSTGSVTGEPTHGLETAHFEPAVNDVIALESFSSLLGSSTTGSNGYNPNVRCPADEPDDSNVADHQHTLEDGGSVPVNRLLRFCRRL